MSIKVTLVAASAPELSALSAMVPHADPQIEVSSVLGGLAELNQEVSQKRPDLVLADLLRIDAADLSTLERAMATAPATALILATPEPSPDFLMRAMRAGVREVVAKPLANGELKVAFDRHLQRLSALRRPATQGRLLAFVPAKGGSGATFLAANLAHALAVRGHRTALIDLNLHFGDCALFVSADRPQHTVADLAREVNRIDGAFLEASMLAAEPNLWVLAAPESPEAAIDVRPEAIERILQVAQQQFEFVIIDVGRVFEAASVKALDQVEAIYLVLQTTLPFLHDGRRVLDLLGNLGYPRDRVRVVVNRAEKGGDIGAAEVQRTLGLPIAAEVPNSYKAVAYSINHGIPILKSAPKDTVSRAIGLLADGLAPQAERKGGAWSRLFAGARA